ncbi:MAG TPA: hypothetical protein DHV63_02850 [Pseudomonas sp.]|nr:hypothetical protein [Pseudomonas sp.]
MDFQSQVAARRAEREQVAREAQKIASEQARTQALAERAQRENALEAIAADLSNDDIKVVRQGEDLTILQSSTPTLDLEGLRRSKIDKLLKHEARKMWSAAENWQVIGLMVAGVFLIPWFWVLGLLVFGVGGARRWALSNRYRAQVRRQYPVLFPPNQPNGAV